MNDEHTQKTLVYVARVLIAITLAMCICFLIGCSRRVVEVEKPIIVEHTNHTNHTDVIRDTLIWKDSVYHYVKGDTIVIERWHHSQTINKWVIADTVRDTIPRIVTITETQIEEVNKLHWWQKVLIWLGGIGIIGTVFIIYKRVS